MMALPTVTELLEAPQASIESVRLEHPDALFLRDVRLVVHEPRHGGITVSTVSPAPRASVSGRTFPDACAHLADLLVRRARELRDRGDDQLMSEDLRVWGQLSMLLVLRGGSSPALPDLQYSRHDLGRGWWLDCWSTGRAVLTWHSPRWPEQEGATQAALHLEPAQALHLAALLEGRGR